MKLTPRINPGACDRKIEMILDYLLVLIIRAIRKQRWALIFFDFDIIVS